MPKRFGRELAAILYAAVAGYSRLSGEDQEGPIARYFQEFEPLGGTDGASRRSRSGRDGKHK